MVSHVRLFLFILTALFLCTSVTQGQQLSITGVSPNPVCANSSIVVTYSYSAGDAGNLYLLLNGPGTSDILISAASVSGGNGSIQGTIPADRSTGTYSVRLLRISGTTGTLTSPASTGFTVNALPAAPGVSNVAYCLNATAIPLTASGQNLKWYNSSSGGVGVTPGPTPVTSATGTTNYYVSQTVNGCEGPRANLQVTISQPVKPTVTSSVSYCQGSNPASLAGAVTSGSNLKWYSSASGGVGSTVAPVPSTSSVGPITYYVSQTVSGCEGDRAEITVTTKAAPTAPSVTTPVTYCQAAVASPLSATAVSGGTLNWFGTSNNALGSTAPTPPTTSPGTTFYSVSQTFSGCEGPKASIQVTINTRPVAPTTAPVSVCQGTTPVSLATGVTSGTNLRWYTSSTGGTGSTVAPAPPTTTVGQTPYYVSQVDNNGCESDRAVLSFVVNGYPAVPAVNSLAYCQNATATSLTATAAPNATLNFYLTSSGGTRYASLTPSTSASNNYYVSQTVNGCESQRATITVSIRSLPPIPAVTLPAAYCQFAAAAPLSATANTNFSLNWYGTNATGGTASAVAPTPSTNSAGSFQYYVSQSDPFGCESIRADITVTVNPKPSAPTVTNASACLNSVPASLTSSVTATGTLKWYVASSGGTGSTVAPTLSTSAIGSVTYYVTQTSSGCESDRAAITFTVNPLPTAPTVASPFLFLCQNSVATSLTATGTNLKWYTVNTGGTALTNPVTPSTDVAGPSVAYYVSQTDANGCESARTTLTVTVISRPAPPTVSSAPVVYCQSSTPVPLSATAITGNTLNWYGPNATGGVASLTATIPSTSTPGSTLYYVSQTDGNGCESSTRASINVTVNAKPNAPTTTSTTLCQNATPILLTTTVTSGSNLKWYTAQTGGTMYVGTPVLSTSAVGTTTYYVSQTSADGCESDRSVVVVTIKPLPVAPTVTPNPQLLCQSSVASSLTAIGTGSLRWYDASGSVYTSITPSTSAVGPQSYSVSQILDGCEGPKAALNIVVIAKPGVPTVSSPVALCQQSTPVALTASGTNLKWYTTSTGGIGSTVAPAPPTSVSGTTAFYVSQTDANGCESDRSTINVIIRAAPIPTLASSGTLTCAITSVTLTAGTGINYNFSGPGIVSQSSLSGTAVVSAAGIYSVVVTNANGCAATQTISVQSNTTAPTAALTQNGPLSPGSPSATLTASGGNLYAFSGPGIVSQNPLLGTAIANVSGTYSVTVTSTNGCSSTASVALIGTDLTPIIIMPQANFMATGSTVDFLVRIFEVAGLPTSMGNINVVITAPAGYVLFFNQFITSTNVTSGDANVAVSNVNWTVSPELANRQLSLTIKPGQSIPAGGAAVLGLSIIRTTASPGSVSNITVAIQDDSSKGYDGFPANNVYARVINGL